MRGHKGAAGIGYGQRVAWVAGFQGKRVTALPTYLLMRQLFPTAWSPIEMIFMRNIFVLLPLRLPAAALAARILATRRKEGATWMIWAAAH